MKLICRNCHFLVEIGASGEYSMEKVVRERHKTGQLCSEDKYIYKPKCYHGFWAYNSLPEGSSRFIEINERERNNCPYVDFTEGMTLEAAKIRIESNGKIEKEENPLLLEPNLYGLGIDLKKIFPWIKQKVGKRRNKR